MDLKKLLLLPVLACACACGSKYYYEDAVQFEKQGMLLKAADHYRLFAERNPSDERAPGALFKAAEIYSRGLGLCVKSGPVLERLLKNYPAYKSRPEAMKALFICPDYFPVDRPAAWTYGDSETGGRNARQLMRVEDVSPSGSVAMTRVYAGKSRISKQKRTYRYSGRDLVESRGGFDTIILKYPVDKGLSWVSSSGGRKARFTVEAAGLRIKVRAGEFRDCIKVKQQLEGIPSWIYEYYAPWTGRVLTSVGGKNFENRVVELVKYEETHKK